MPHAAARGRGAARQIDPAGHTAPVNTKVADRHPVAAKPIGRRDRLRRAVVAAEQVGEAAEQCGIDRARELPHWIGRGQPMMVARDPVRGAALCRGDVPVGPADEAAEAVEVDGPPVPPRSSVEIEPARPVDQR